LLSRQQRTKSWTAGLVSLAGDQATATWSVLEGYQAEEPADGESAVSVGRTLAALTWPTATSTLRPAPRCPLWVAPSQERRGPANW